MGRLRVALCTKRWAHQTLQEAHWSKAIQMQSLRQVSQYIFMKTWVSFHKRRNGGRGIQQLFCGNNNCELLFDFRPPSKESLLLLVPVPFFAPALTTTTAYIFKLVNRSDITGEGGEQGSGMDGWKGVGVNGLDEKSRAQVFEWGWLLWWKRSKPSFRETAESELLYLLVD